MSIRPGNRSTANPALTGKPGNRLPGALYSPQLGLARDAAAAVEQASSEAAVGGDVSTLDQRLDEFEGGGGGVRTVTADDAFGPGDSMILADCSGGPIDLDLPAAAAGPRTVTAKKIDASANALTLIATGGDTLNGTATTTTQNATISATTAGTSADWYGG